jgi:hypothetical protein
MGQDSQGGQHQAGVIQPKFKNLPFGESRQHHDRFGSWLCKNALREVILGL